MRPFREPFLIKFGDLRAGAPPSIEPQYSAHSFVYRTGNALGTATTTPAEKRVIETIDSGALCREGQQSNSSQESGRNPEVSVGVS